MYWTILHFTCQIFVVGLVGIGLETVLEHWMDQRKEKRRNEAQLSWECYPWNQLFLDGFPILPKGNAEMITWLVEQGQDLSEPLQEELKVLFKLRFG